MVGEDIHNHLPCIPPSLAILIAQVVPCNFVPEPLVAVLRRFYAYRERKFRSDGGRMSWERTKGRSKIVPVGEMSALGAGVGMCLIYSLLSMPLLVTWHLRSLKLSYYYIFARATIDNDRN